jgi:hypothetical protein
MRNTWMRGHRILGSCREYCTKKVAIHTKRAPLNSKNIQVACIRARIRLLETLDTSFHFSTNLQETWKVCESQGDKWVFLE